jgi:hypothetical protein
VDSSSGEKLQIILDTSKTDVVGLDQRMLQTLERLTNLAARFEQLVQCMAHSKETIKDSPQNDKVECQQHQDDTEINWIYKRKRKLSDEEGDTGGFKPISGKRISRKQNNTDVEVIY